MAEADGRFAYEGLDRALHEKARLGILTALVGTPFFIWLLAGMSKTWS